MAGSSIYRATMPTALPILRRCPPPPALSYLKPPARPPRAPPPAAAFITLQPVINPPTHEAHTVGKYVIKGHLRVRVLGVNLLLSGDRIPNDVQSDPDRDERECEHGTEKTRDRADRSVVSLIDLTVIGLLLYANEQVRTWRRVQSRR